MATTKTQIGTEYHLFIKQQMAWRSRYVPLGKAEDVSLFGISVQSCNQMHVWVEQSHVLTRFEEQNSNLAQIEVDEMFGLVSHIAAKISSHNAVPSRIVLLVKLLKDSHFIG